jgi:hypothetical protein
MVKADLQSNANVTETEKVHLTLANRVGVLFGVAATFLGGVIGATSGKVSGKFSPLQGFTLGAAIAGAWTTAVQVVSYFRTMKENPVAASLVSDNDSFILQP